MFQASVIAVIKACVPKMKSPNFDAVFSCLLSPVFVDSVTVGFSQDAGGQHSTLALALRKSSLRLSVRGLGFRD